MDNEHILHWLWLCEALAFSKIKPLHKDIGNADIIYSMTDYDDYIFLTDDDKMKLCNKNLENAKKCYETCKRKNIHIIVWDSKAYPPLLRHIDEPPLILYAKGLIPDWKTIFTVGIVGTRKMSSYGNKITNEIAVGIAQHGGVIVTGLAVGNDIVATRAAIKNKKFTIALLGGGVDVVYPKENELEYDYLSKHGLLLSEQPPQMPPKSWTFPRRNRILAGICRAVIVTEAPEKSGALITAHLAADAGRDVYAIPGSVNLKSCKGTNMLLQEGVTPIISPESFFELYSELSPKQEEQTASKDEETPIVQLSENEKKVFDALFNQDMTTDELICKTELSATDCSSACFMLELKKLIERLPGNLYHREE